ncbi:hypothetical protein Tco_0420373 [Tanacetum coccineum]
MSENEDSYHDTILDLEAKLNKNVDLILENLANSLQGMFMLGPNPLSVYDPQLKHGLGYCGHFVDASKGPTKYKRKMNDQLQKYFPSSFIPSDKTPNATSSVPASMPMQSLIKERENLKLEYQKLFDSIKKIRSQSQKEIDELIDHVSEKTYAYGAIRVENQNLLSTISELQTRLETVEKGMNAAISVRRPMNKDSLSDSVLANSKNSAITFSTNSRTPKSSDTTYVVLKTRFSEKLAQSKSLDTTSVVSKPKIDVGSMSKAKHKVVQIVLWIVDSGCSKHMMGDRSLLKNFIEKFMGIVHFGNDNFAAITGYDDYIQGNITICHVYYVEGLGYNLFSVGQFCDGDLEVAFRSKTCYVRYLEGDDLLTRGRESNLELLSPFLDWCFFQLFV